ncbi:MULTISPECIES: hypothetical protein [Priestia]|uniref:hypothetical protein n=1 Tax=Priestia TaxID=2800373 RepID=UPI0002DD064D|nr:MULTISPECIES: hypothetical protein [Priestia]MDT3763590.1 hypothetical protein [Priestia filamentosa]MED3726131.1 hypothetical protein [Priestia filamentosa]UOE62221.1 hypothetical protein HPB58_08605 [Priestia filamentosa]WCM14239.1 hypothetical protein PGN40_12860 [Priestia filamentosa]WRU94022.1 hypothetical protein RYX51_13425 [Priestia filamentosa]
MADWTMLTEQEREQLSNMIEEMTSSEKESDVKQTSEKIHRFIDLLEEKQQSKKR